MTWTCRHVVLFSMLLLAFPTSSDAQYYYYDNGFYDSDLVVEVGLGAGGMNCVTDVSGTRKQGGSYVNDINLKNTRLNGSFFVGVQYRGFIGARFEATYGNIQAYDSIAKHSSGAPLQRYLGRNASFRSSIREVALLAEFYPLRISPSANGWARVSPYLVAGVGWFAFNPQTFINNQWIDLKPLRTEGQGFSEHKDRQPYSLHQANIPVGGGLLYELSPLFNLRAEFLHRIVLTDYLDDVSTRFIEPSLFDKYLQPIQAAQAKAVYNRASMSTGPGSPRGNSRNKDYYMTLNLKVAMVLGRERK